MQSPPSLVTTTIVQAGAGTGKTESLARRIIDVAQFIYDKKGAVPRFVATTFTERATAELRERVVSTLGKREGAPAWLAEFVQDPQDLHISTIHGTLALILHRFGTLLGLDPEFTILRGPDEYQLLNRVLRGIISTHDEFTPLLEQYAFGELAEAVKILVSHYRLHGDAFKPATGWQLIFKRQHEELLMTLESLGGVTLGELPPKLAEAVAALQKLPPALRAAGDDFVKLRDEFLNVVGEMKKPSISEKSRGAELKPTIDKIFELKKDFWGTDAFDPLINERYDEVSASLSSLVKLASEQMTIEKRELGVLTFDDLEFMTLDLVENHRDALLSIQREWDFWFIDEYQDTSPLQKKLLFYFFRSPWNAYFVGDPQQSIYLFRGADERVFQDTRLMIQQKNGAVEKLDVNYRSQPDLLKFMNTLFTTMKTGSETPIEPLRPKGQLENQIRSRVHLASDDVDEQKIVVDQILNWRQEGHLFHEMAVLVRTNDKARSMAHVLAEAGVPVYVHTTGGYYDRREVLDALALLSFIEDPSDDEVFILLARSPWVAVPDQTLAKWGLARGKSLTYWAWLQNNQDEIKSLRTMNVLAESIKKAETRPLSTVFENLVTELGLMEFCLVGDASGRREANLRKLLHALREAEATPGFSAAAFLENAWRELVEPGDEGEAASFIEPQRVNIMTIHKSKGLKFNCVAVPYCNDAPRVSSSLLELAPDGSWAIRILALDVEEKVAPIMHGALKEKRRVREQAENGRVFYVAVTRAAEKLALVGKLKAGEKSWLSQVSIPLDEGVHDNNYEVRNWLTEPERRIYTEPAADEKERAPKLSERVARHTHRLTVTQVVGAHAAVRATGQGKQTRKARELASEFKRQIESRQLGQALHQIFEHVSVAGGSGGATGSDGDNLDRVCKAAISRFGIQGSISEAAIRKTLDLHVPPLREIIVGGRREWPFDFRQDDVYLKGQIDLWGSVGGTTWIIDYKSVREFKPETVAKATEQLELYALAVHKLGIAWDEIKLAIVSPLLGESQVVEKKRDLQTVISTIKPMPVDSWSDAEI